MGDVPWLVALCGLAFYWRLGYPSLFDFNEGLYVQAAREMLLRGDWITGTVNGIPFYDKPPLALWCAAAAFRVLGVSELAARLPVALAATCATLVTYGLARAAMGRRLGLYAAAFLALNPLFMGTTRQMTMDIHQTWWVTAAIGAFWMLERPAARMRWIWSTAFWACCGLGFMSKSFPGLLPIPVVLVYIGVTSGGSLRRAWERFARLQPLAGIVVLALIVAPWHVAAYRQSGHYFIEQYWYLHHVGLLKATDFDHSQPVWYYVPMLFVGFLPWSVWLPFVRIQRADSAVSDESSRTRVLALTWALVIFLTFTAMRSKLISYLLPMYPACAILAASVFSDPMGTYRRRLAACAMAAIGLNCWIVVGLTASVLSPLARSSTDPETIALATPDMFAFACVALSGLGLGLIVAGVCVWREARCGVAPAVAGMCWFVAAACTIGLPAYERSVNEPLRRIVAEASRRMVASDTNQTRLVIHIGRPRRPSVFFYLPESLFRQKPATIKREAILLESWDAAPVRDFIRENGRSMVIGDFSHASKTLAGYDVRVPARNGRWALFEAQPSGTLR